MRPYTIGIDVGGTKVAYGLFESGSLVDRMQHPADPEADGPAFSDRIIASVNALMEKNGIAIDQVEGVGVCMPSFIMYEQGYIYLTSALPKIKDFAMRDYMQARIDTKVVLDNDSNGAALAEYRHGAGRGLKHMVYMSASTGLGSGLIINGELFRGTYGWAGESGHMLITPDAGVLCGCENRGCFMSYASGRYIPNHVRIRLDEGRQSVLSREGTLNGEALLKAFNAGDAVADEVIDQLAHYMAVCLYNIYQMLNINVFVFGGGLLHFGDTLFGRVRREFDRYNHIPLPVEFRFAELKQDFGIIGASELVR